MLAILQIVKRVYKHSSYIRCIPKNWMSTGAFPKVKILDGGLGTELERNGFERLKTDPLWSARILEDEPSAIKNIHKSFLRSGSEAIISASYQASIDGFMKYCGKTKEEAKELIALSMKIAKDAVEEFKSEEKAHSKKCYVAASIAPYGACLHDSSEYSGNYTESVSQEFLKDWHRQRLDIIMAEQPDYLAVETVPCLKEAVAIAELLREYPSAKAWISFSSVDGKNTPHGENFREAVVEVLKYPQVCSVGVNCCHPEHIEDLLISVQDVLTPSKTFIAYPNIGKDFIDGEWIVRENDLRLPAYVRRWLEIGGIEWVGGCCGSEPIDIEKINKVVSQMQLSK